MRAVRFNAWKTFPVIEEIPKPSPGPGEVLLRVAGAGACHSDVAIFQDFDDSMPQAPMLKPSYTLGHENAGWVEAVGEGVSGIAIDGAYLVYGPMGCGHCPSCSIGQDTYCDHAHQADHLGIGLGRDGGMAEYVVVPARNLVPLGAADPVVAAPLSDAGLTPYHAIKLAMPRLTAGGKTALVIGLGGLGQVAVQMLEAMTGAKVIATDVKPEAMARAEQFGATTVPSGEDQVAQIRDLTEGRGVDAVFDFVGISPTIRTAQQTVARKGRITVVGIANGPVEWSFFTNPYEAELTNTYWGTIEDLWEVAALYRAGQIKPDVEIYSMDRALEAYRNLAEGKLSARAVVTPNA